MTDFLESAADICKRIGQDPAHLCTLPDLVEILRTAGFPISKGTIYKAQMRDEGPPLFIFCNRAIYRLGDGIEWALKRVRTTRRKRISHAAIDSVAVAV
jgi:hypothetical protein